MPDAGLIAVNGTLYGTTWEGGGSGCDGSGTVFALTPQHASDRARSYTS
jgi:hypothetical protein